MSKSDYDGMKRKVHEAVVVEEVSCLLKLQFQGYTFTLGKLNIIYIVSGGGVMGIIAAE